MSSRSSHSAHSQLTNPDETDSPAIRVPPLPWPKPGLRSGVGVPIVVSPPSSNYTQWLDKLSSGLTYAILVKSLPNRLELWTATESDYDALQTNIGEGFHTYTPRSRRQFRRIARGIPPGHRHGGLNCLCRRRTSGAGEYPSIAQTRRTA